MYEPLAYIACKQTDSLEDAWERYLIIARFCPACNKKDFENWYSVKKLRGDNNE
ncbi:MAG: hypothetical protein GX879_05765 [Bacteroidales bacterium]|nr:hypothetical protein [Bacteroidales bacterium]